MAQKIIGLFKGKKKADPTAPAAPAQQSGPIITPLGGAPAASSLPGISDYRRRNRLQGPTILSNRLGG